MKRFLLPDLGEGLKEAELVAWHVAEGDHVVADQPLVAVETEKAVVEVPSPQSGRIARLFGKPGERLAVGAVLAEFEEGSHPDAGTVVGELATAPAPPAPARPAQTPSSRRAGPAIKAAPAVRALARERGVDLAAVRPTGPEGTLTRADVIAAAKAPGAEAGAASGGEVLAGVRRAMALNMARAHAAVVPATLFDEVEVGAWWTATADVTLRLIRAIAAGAAAAPALNAWFDGTGISRQLHGHVDLGIAVDTASGLIVPVLRDVDRRGPAELRSALDRLKAAARERTVPLEELRGATITLSNFGMLAGRHAALVILPPQVAILGAGRIGMQARPEGAGVAFRPVLPLSLTFDHRAVTGGDAAAFMAAAMADLRQPV